LNPQKFTKDEPRDFAHMTLEFSMAELFRNSSPGALTLEQAWELERSRAAQLRNQQNHLNPFGASGAQEPTPPNRGTPEPKPDTSSLDGILSGMSTADLMKLKYALSNAGNATTGFGVAIGALVFLINPASPWVVATLAGVAVMTVLWNDLANKVDQYLATQ